MFAELYCLGAYIASLDAYIGPCKTTMMKLFLQKMLTAKRSIIDV